MNKIYSKTDYLKYRKNLPSGTIKDKILALCFENYQDSNNTLRTDILQYILGYKISLSNNGETQSQDYSGCSNILGGNFRTLTYTKIAEEFGYDLVDNPRLLTTRGSLMAFDADIVHGNLNPELQYTGEYFSYVYCLNRRTLVLDSVLWDSCFSNEIRETVECIRKRADVFTKFFQSSSSLQLPDFIKPFQNTQYSPEFLELAYGDDTYGEWEYKWPEFTGRNWYDWTREDQLFHSRFSEAIEQYLELHQNMVLTMERLELLYYAELSIIQGVSGIWNFENGDIDGEEKTSILNKTYTRLSAVGNAINADMSRFKDMAEKLKEQAAMYYDSDAVLDILGWKIYL